MCGLPPVAGAYGLQKFDKQPQYSEVNPGEDIKLDCKVHNKRGTCSWQKDNKVSTRRPNLTPPYALFPPRTLMSPHLHDITLPRIHFSGPLKS